MSFRALGLTIVLLDATIASGSCSRICSTEAKLQHLDSALMSFHLLAGRYPTQEEGLRVLVAPPAPTSPPLRRWQQFFERVPLDCWQRAFVYSAPAAENDRPRLYSLGRDGESNSQGNDPDDINNWNEDRPWDRYYTRSSSFNFRPGFKVLLIAGGLLLLATLTRTFRRRPLLAEP